MTSYHPAYETLSERELPEYRARGILLRHKKTKAEIYKLLSEDRENSFAFIFRSPPRDGSGVAHIVEHSVLCGSERYPVKDPFLVMARRSLATFLNALTYPDKTIYPAASAVRADFFNLMSVYGDAVFFPKLSRETFLQEAHHLELDEEGRLSIKGVVYNEMRGDYSSGDSLVGTASYTSLFDKGHPYSFDSGGDPEAIPSLSYEAFRDFWAEHYHPSNCKIFLHGDIPLAEELAFLEEHFLSRFEAREVRTEIPLQAPFAAPVRLRTAYPVTEGSEAGTQIVVNWLTAPVTDEVEALGLEALSEILLGHDGSPLAHALRSSGLGEDLSPQCGLDSLFRQIIFSAGLRGTEAGKEEEIEKLILATLTELVESGIRPEAREAAIHSIAFSNREIRRGSTSFGLRLMSRSLRGWLHGAGPEATLSFTEAMRGLEERLKDNPRHLEDLITRLLLENPHRSTVTVYPKEGLLEELKAEVEARLAVQAAGLGKDERAAILADMEALKKAQETAEPEGPDPLPAIKRADIPRDIETVPREKDRIGVVDLSLHPIFTNGIVYLDLAFPADRLPRAAQLWLPFLSRFMAGAGLPGLPYGKVAEAMTLNAGGFGASLECGSPVGAAGHNAWVAFRLKALAERFPAAVDLALRLLSEADTDDEKRVDDLLAELGNDILSAIVPGGNSFALARAGAYHSPSLGLEELWRGTSQIRFVSDLRDGKDSIPIGDSLKGLRTALFARQGLRVSLSADPARLGEAKKALSDALARLPESPAPASTLEAAELLKPQARHEAYSISAQVGFAAAACPASRLGSPEMVHESVLSHLLTTGALWEELRVRRGAYGASAYIESLEGVALFSTYRDPSPANSIELFGEALREAAAGKGLEAAEEAIVGSAGRDLKPLLPEEKTIADFRRELFGISDELRREKRATLLATSEEDLKKAAGRLAESYEAAASVLISHGEDVQLARRLRPDTAELELPL